MSESQLATPLETPSEAHEHAWQLVSVETDCGGVEIRESVCTTCSEVQIAG